MKVLAVSSSPRPGGNSDVLCDQFLKGATDSGHMVSKVRLEEKHIQPCHACYQCCGSKRCAQEDGMDPILSALMDADVIVLSTPVYFYSMTAQMKTMIDRCLPRYREIANKKFYFIVTAADPERSTADVAIAGLRGFLRCLPGAEEAGTIYGMGAWDKGDIYRHPAFNDAYEAGKTI